MRKLREKKDQTLTHKQTLENRFEQGYVAADTIEETFEFASALVCKCR